MAYGLPEGMGTITDVVTPKPKTYGVWGYGLSGHGLRGCTVFGVRVKWLGQTESVRHYPVAEEFGLCSA